MAIVYIAHDEIDYKKWDRTIEGSTSPLIYGLSWYLDCVTNNSWDALVCDDYRAVMPLPYNKKILGIYQLYQPPFTQQLGLFSIDHGIDVQTFIEQIPAKFKRKVLSFNHSNSIQRATEKTNLVLDLSQPYESTFAAYSSSVRKRLRKMGGYKLEETDNLELLIRLYKEELEPKIGLSEDTYDLAKKLFSTVLNHKMGKVYQLQKDGKTVACGMFLICFKRVINVFAANLRSEPNAMTKLLNDVIQKHSMHDEIFDFEGSEIEGVKKYFLSFKPQEQNYSVYEDDNLSPLIKMLLRLRRNFI